MLPIQKSESAVTQLPLGTMFEGFDFENENFMFGVYWGSCNELVKADIDFPRIPGYEPYGDFRHITSEAILKAKPDGVNIVTVIYNDFMKGAVMQYGNYGDCWVMLGRLYGFA